jgi:hypothetical protein
MTSTMKETKDPLTSRWEMAFWNDDHFGVGKCGVKFPDGTIYNPDITKLKTREDDSYEPEIKH